MKDLPVRIVQISDIHLFADKKEELLGVKTYESFSAVIDLLKKDSVPQLILLTGDLSQDFTDISYMHVAEKMKDFPLPVYCVPGNHDDANKMAKLFPYENVSNIRHVILEHWQIILLDSQKPGSVVGYLNPNEINFLKECLQKYPEHHALIVFHHQPKPVGCAWLDHYTILNAVEFWHTLSHYPNVKGIIFGHVHQENEGSAQGIPYYSVPSTCIQFKKNSDDFALDHLPPGYRWLDLYPNGEIKTAVCRVKNYVGTFDPNAKGYK